MFTSKKIFAVILITMVACCGGFWTFVYNPQQKQYLALQQDLEKTIERYDKASRAQQDLDNIRQRLERESASLFALEGRFIDKGDLSIVTEKMRDLSRKHNLQLVDFTPAFSAFFADTSQSEVKALPFSITVKGHYLNIGRFIESWSQQDFYIVAEEAYVGKSDRRGRDLEADISGRLYAWAKGDR